MKEKMYLKFSIQRLKIQYSTFKKDSLCYLWKCFYLYRTKRVARNRSGGVFAWVFPLYLRKSA